MWKFTFSWRFPKGDEVESLVEGNRRAESLLKASQTWKETVRITKTYLKEKYFPLFHLLKDIFVMTKLKFQIYEVRYILKWFDLITTERVCILLNVKVLSALLFS